MNLQLFKPKGQRLKDRVLKNREAILDVMADNIKGARQCPHLVGQKCIGILCEHFVEFKTINDETKNDKTYYRCVHVQLPLLIIELNQNIRSLLTALKEKEDVEITT